MSLLAYQLAILSHLTRFHLCHHHAYTPMSTGNTASHYNHKKINLWLSFAFLYGYEAPLGGPSGYETCVLIPYGIGTLFEVATLMTPFY